MPRVYGNSPGNPSFSSGSHPSRSSGAARRSIGRLDTVENSTSRSGRWAIVGPRVSSSHSFRVRLFLQAVASDSAGLAGFVGLVAMTSVLLEQRAGDHDALDLARAFVDRGDARVTVVALDGELLGKSVAAVDLDGLVRDPVGGLGGEELRHRGGATPAGTARVPIGGGPHDEQPRRVHEGGHLCELLLDRSELRDRLPEGPPLARVPQGLVERGLRDADSLRADPDPARFEAGERDREPRPLLAQEVLHGNLAVLEHDAAGLGRAQPHLLFELPEPEAPESGLHDEGADPLLAPVGIAHGEDDEDLPHLDVRDPGLLARQDPAVALADGARP